MDIGGFLFELRAPHFKLFLGRFGCALGFAFRDQVIAGVTVLYCHNVAERAKINYFFHQNDLHDFLLASD